MPAIVKYLKTHPSKAEEYMRLKKKAIRYAKGNGNKYRRYKSRFFERMIKGLYEIDSKRRKIE